LRHVAEVFPPARQGTILIESLFNNMKRGLERYVRRRRRRREGGEHKLNWVSMQTECKKNLRSEKMSLKGTARSVEIDGERNEVKHSAKHFKSQK